MQRKKARRELDGLLKDQQAWSSWGKLEEMYPDELNFSLESPPPGKRKSLRRLTRVYGRRQALNENMKEGIKQLKEPDDMKSGLKMLSTPMTGEKEPVSLQTAQTRNCDIPPSLLAKFPDYVGSKQRLQTAIELAKWQIANFMDEEDVELSLDDLSNIDEKSPLYWGRFEDDLRHELQERVKLIPAEETFKEDPVEYKAQVSDFQPMELQQAKQSSESSELRIVSTRTLNEDIDYFNIPGFGVYTAYEESPRPIKIIAISQDCQEKLKFDEESNVSAEETLICEKTTETMNEDENHAGNTVGHCSSLFSEIEAGATVFQMASIRPPCNFSNQVFVNVAAVNRNGGRIVQTAKNLFSSVPSFTMRSILPSLE